MFFVVKNISGKHLRLLHSGLLVEVPEEQLDLGPGAVAEPELDVDPAVRAVNEPSRSLQLYPLPAGPDEGGVQPLRVVGGEEAEPRLGGHHAVQRVQQAGQRDLGLASVGGPGGTRGHSMTKQFF